MHSTANNRHRHIDLLELVSNNAPPPQNLANLHPASVIISSSTQKNPETYLEHTVCLQPVHAYPAKLAALSEAGEERG